MKFTDCLKLHGKGLDQNVLASLTDIEAVKKMEVSLTEEINSISEVVAGQQEAAQAPEKVKKAPEVVEKPAKLSVQKKQIPEFKTTGEAVKFGKKASAAEIAKLKKTWKTTKAEAESLQKAGKIQEASDLGFKAQLYREAFQAAEGRDFSKIKLSIKTPEFKKWFGKSKVVDENGEPLVVYHGTRTPIDFDEFSTEGPPYDDEGIIQQGSGHDPTAYLGAHFAKEAGIADYFAEGRGWTKGRFWGEGEESPRIIPAFLAIQNPKPYKTESELRKDLYKQKVPFEDLIYETKLFRKEEDNEDVFWGKYENKEAFRIEVNSEIYDVAGTDEWVRSAAMEAAYALNEELSNGGYDGIVYGNEIEGGTSYIAFEPTQIKSVYNKGAFSPKDPRIMFSVKDKQPVWYSQMEKSVENVKQKSMPAKQWVEMLNSAKFKQQGVKQEEIDWSGVTDWLSEQTGKVTKQEVLTYLKENNVQIKEVVKGENLIPVDEKDKAVKFLQSEGFVVKEHEDGSMGVTEVKHVFEDGSVGKGQFIKRETLTTEQAKQFDIIDKYQKQKSDAYYGYENEDNTKFSQYQEPGGSSYKEVLLTLPVKPPKYDRRDFIDYYNELTDKYSLDARKVFGDVYVKLQEKATKAELSKLDMLDSETVVEKKADEYTGGHWEESSVLAHMRVNERTDAEGKSVLFLEEVQSDYAAEYRKQLTNIEKSVTNNFKAIVKNMETLGILEEIC